MITFLKILWHIGKFAESQVSKLFSKYHWLRHGFVASRISSVPDIYPFSSFVSKVYRSVDRSQLPPFPETINNIALSSNKFHKV